jgi:L-aminopeptidase/D-esterase-like protein
VRAICFAGGSLYGLEAGVGVAAELLARGGYEVGWMSIAPVSAAIVFDFRGRRRARAARPGARAAHRGGRGAVGASGEHHPDARGREREAGARPLRQLARQVHASLSRAIHPFHSLVDGDVLYAATTNEVENPLLDSARLGVVASELAWDAVLSCFD